MSKISRAVSNQKKEESLGATTNFMNGISYKLNPIQTLQLVAASSIFGEAQYYRSSGFYCSSSSGGFHYSHDSVYLIDDLITDALFPEYNKKTATEFFTDVIDKALDYDYEATIRLAVHLRNTYYMRLNPQVIMVRAALHPKRAEFNKTHPGLFRQLEYKVMKRPDEPAMQAAYYLWLNDGKKNQMPSILKRSMADRLEALSPVQINKYKNFEIGMINTVRLCHANSTVINELMKTGTVNVVNEQKTWEQLRSDGATWADILHTIDIGHMALLRNLRNIFKEISDMDTCKRILQKLKDGVPDGKQFPFRYSSAYTAIDECTDVINHKQMILDALEECIDIAVDNFPHLSGRTVALSDNSGSAWGRFVSEYGIVRVANIDNLSAVLACACSDEGDAVKFGDRYIAYPISKRKGVLSQAHKIDKGQCDDVGGATEGGIWKYLWRAIKNKEHIDNLFIYSDMQAGTGGLYGEHSDIAAYSKMGYGCGPRFTGRQHIDVYKLIQTYRKKINPKLNVFCIQTAGYDNTVMPIMAYRCAIMTGWTGKEISFANEYIKQWDNIEASQ